MDDPIKRAEELLKLPREGVEAPGRSEFESVLYDVIEDVKRMRAQHRKEQRDSADRLRAALENQRTGRILHGDGNPDE